MKALVCGALSLILLAGCGVEGAPVRPSLDAGVTVTRGGIYPSASVGVNRGPVSLRVGL
ncbi:MAG: hypothetical protein LPK02_01060 [Rhodobacterales bacterium]|nr:hypothetical protein [Rhodobacterales bacterium]MDX5411623.1 hypothetical protein [Rhodobacterales bacterium]